MQMVILCGGLGTRLGRISEAIPKSLVPVSGRPFVAYQLDLLRRWGFAEAVLCIGHRGQQIREECGGGDRWGLQIRYSEDGEHPLGTGGSVKKAAPLLQGVFFVMNGDTFLPIDFKSVMDRFIASGNQGMMVVYRNLDRFDTSNVLLEDGLVARYEKGGHLPGMEFIDAGVTLFRKEALERLPAGEPSSMGMLYQCLVSDRQLAAYETSQRFYEVGSPSGLEEFRLTVDAEGAPGC